MKALTLHDPWATLVAYGVKHIETRSWAPSHRGPLAVASAARHPHRVVPAGGTRAGSWRAKQFTEDAGGGWELTGPGLPELGPLGGVPHHPGHILCVRQLVEVLPMVPYLGDPDSPDVPDRCVLVAPTMFPVIYRRDLDPGERMEVIGHTEFAAGDYGPDRYAWILAGEDRLAEPIKPPPGHHQRLWEWEPPSLVLELMAKLDASLAAARAMLDPLPRCPVHVGVPEPCPTCQAYIAAGL